MDSNIKISICVPVHKMNDWKYWLEKCLDSILAQTEENIEVVITDNSDDDEIKRFTEKYAMPIKFFKNPRKGMAQNTNEAIKRATGPVIKILYMDDHLAHKDALSDILEAFKEKKLHYWLATPCEHTYGKNIFKQHAPKLKGIEKGINTIGSPSVVAFRNNNPLLFDENMTWLLDVDLYKRLLDIFGEPIILEKVGVVIGLHDGQVTNILTNEKKQKEEEYFKAKHGI